MSQARVLLLDENRGFGGAERHAVTLGHELHQRGILASIVGRKDSWLSKAASRSLPFSPCGFRNEVDMFSVFGIYKLAKSLDANILHCIAHRDLVAAALARQLPGAPKLVLLKAEHSFPDNDLSPLFRWAYRQCDGLASVSQAMQSSLLDKLQTESPWECQKAVIANGIDLAPPRTGQQPRAERMKIGVLSALNPGKGHRELFEALAGTGLRGRIDISAAGDGPLRGELEQFCLANELPVEFQGHVEDPTAYLQSLDLCLLPSQKETFSLVALECLTLGVPLLAADSEGVQELYPEPAMVYKRGDAAELIAKLQAFLDNPAPYQQRAVSLASDYRERYSRQRMGDNYQAFYSQLLESASASARA